MSGGGRRLIRRVLVAGAALVAGVGFSACETSDGFWNYHPLEVKGTFEPLVGDFAGDGASDIFWYAVGPTGDALWIGREGARGASAFRKVSQSITGDYRPVVGDFAGDDRDDILWYAPGTRGDALWVSQGDGRFSARSLVISGYFEDVVRLRDYHEGKDDILWHSRYTSRDEYRWRMDDAGSGSYISDRLTLTDYASPTVGDWDGDGYEDVFFSKPNDRTKQYWLLPADGTVIERELVVNGTSQPTVIYDVPRDGILWWADGTGQEKYTRPDASGTFASVPVRTVDGSGRVSTFPIGAAIVSGPQVYDALFIGTETEGEFYELASEGHEKGSQLPLVGDFDGDGGYDVVWYAAGSAADEIWYLEPPAGDAAARALRANPHLRPSPEAATAPPG